MREALEFLSLVSTGLFAGAAAYITFVEHPARMSCGTQLAATEFGPSYHRATVMQASLAALAVLTGVGTWLSGASIGWAAGAALIGAVIPITLVIILPVNKRLLASELDKNSTEARVLLEKWAKLHAVRTVLSVGAFFLFAYLLLHSL
jgi:hypothetical protein